jgi:D-alanyl-D-alanine carboxypeptidase
MNLTDAALKAGFELTVISAYRSVDEQKDVVATDIAEYEAQGYSKDEATDLAMKYLTKPGLSEHHTGLALDVLDTEWYNQGNMLDEAFGETEAGKWLAENVCHYGFVIRYEKGKEKITGINYEPWHIRYVGKENAEYMYQNKLVLEEYIDQLKK